MFYFVLKLKSFILSIIIIIIFSTISFSQKIDSPNNHVSNEKEAVADPPKKTDNEKYGFMSSYEYILSVSILGFGTLIILFELYLVKVQQISPEHSVKFIVITLIIISTLFLITAGYNNDQIAPATGLLGTIAGYLLGKGNTNTNVNQRSNE